MEHAHFFPLYQQYKIYSKVCVKIICRIVKNLRYVRTRIAYVLFIQYYRYVCRPYENRKDELVHLIDDQH